MRRWLLVLGSCLAVLLLPSSAWAAVTCTAPLVPSADGTTCVDPGPGASPSSAPAPVVSPSPSAAPSSAPSSAPAPATAVVALDAAQWATVSFGLGLLVFLTAAGTVAGWRK